MFISCTIIIIHMIDNGEIELTLLFGVHSNKLPDFKLHVDIQQQ